MSYINPSSKLFKHLPSLELLQTGRKPIPINVEIDLSNRCDLKCAGCHFAYTHTRGPWAGHADKPEDAIAGGDLMDVDLAMRILDELAACGVKSVTWTGGGEPTLHPKFDAITRYADKVGLEQGIYTHGGFISGARAEWMKMHFTWVYISLDAWDADSYVAYKGVDRFERVCKNIQRLALAEGDATIGVGFLVSAQNWKYIHAMASLRHLLEVDYVQFRPMIDYDQLRPSEFVESDVEWLYSAVGRLNAYRDDERVIADTDRFLRYARWDGHDYETCYWSGLQTVITPNGKVWRCTNKREHGEGLLGDLNIESFARLWERSGGACSVDKRCRVSCRGDVANQTLNKVMAPHAHVNFP